MVALLLSPDSLIALLPPLCVVGRERVPKQIRKNNRHWRTILSYQSSENEQRKHIFARSGKDIEKVNRRKRNEKGKFGTVCVCVYVCC